MTRTQGIFAAACLTLFLTVPFIGLSRVFQVSEAREGTVVVEMLSSENYILPRRNGVLIPSKPPLFHWIGVAIAKVFGSYDEFILRLPSALAAAVTAAILFALAWDIAGPMVAGAQQLLLLSTYGFLRHAADGRVDMLFCMLVCAAIACWLRSAARAYAAGLSLKRIPGHTYCLTGSYVGLAVLAKGPLGALLPLIVISSISIVSWGRASLPSLLRPGWLVALLIALPWYLLAAADGGKSFFERQILFENLSRFVGGEAVNAKPFWFYFKEFWGHAAPWSVLVPLLLLGIYQSRAGADFNSGDRYGVEQKFALHAGIVWFVSLIVFFSLSVGKRSAYLLPLLPALTLIFAIVLVQWGGSVANFSEYTKQRIRWAALLIWLVIVGSGFVTICVAEFGSSTMLQNWPRLGTALTLLPAAMRRSEWILLSMYICFATLSVVAWRAGWRRNQVSLLFAAIFFTLQIPLTVYGAVGMAVRGMTHSFHDFALEVAHQLPAGEKLNIVKRALDEQLDTFIFYYRRPVRLIDPSEYQPESGYVLVQNGWLDSIPRNTRSKLQPIISGGRIANSEDKQWTLALVDLEAAVAR